MIEYSIVYGLLEPETSERLNLGVVIWSGETFSFRWSYEKLIAMHHCMSDKEWKALHKLLTDIENGDFVKLSKDVSYLSRYSNNLIGFSPVRVIDLPLTEESKNWLYKHYICRK